MLRENRVTEGGPKFYKLGPGRIGTPVSPLERSGARFGSHPFPATPERSKRSGLCRGKLTEHRRRKQLKYKAKAP
jgi:hypothetical protein